MNRTEALDMSCAAVREGKLVLPRRDRSIEEFAEHLTCDAKVLDEDEETGAKKYRYIRTGTNHFSMAFTYAWLVALPTSPLLPWLEGTAKRCACGTYCGSRWSAGSQ